MRLFKHNTPAESRKDKIEVSRIIVHNNKLISDEIDNDKSYSPILDNHVLSKINSH